jgi:hypothetical protein
MSRFSADLSVVDEHLSRYMDNLFQFSSALLTLIVVVCLLVPSMIAVVGMYLGLYSLQVVGVDRVNRSVKRAANNAMVRALSSNHSLLTHTKGATISPLSSLRTGSGPDGTE